MSTVQKKTKKKKSKKKFQFKKLLRFFVIIGLFGLIIFGLANIPTKNIYISGNKLLSDYDILEVFNRVNNSVIYDNVENQNFSNISVFQNDARSENNKILHI